MQLQEIILWGAKAVRGWRYFAARYVVGTVLHSFSFVSRSQFLARFVLNWGNGGKQNSLVQFTMDISQENSLLVYFFSLFKKNFNSYYISLRISPSHSWLVVCF